MNRLFAMSLILTLMAACSADPNEQANKRFIEAQQLIEKAEKLPAAERVGVMKTAEQKLKSILSDYPSSALAVQLASGQAVGRVSLTAVSGAIESASWEVCVEAPKRRCLLEKARQIAGSAKTDSARARALGEVAAGEAKDGRSAEASATFAAALQIAKSITHEVMRAIALEGIVTAYGRAGQCNEARDLALSIQNEGIRARAATEAARACARAGRTEEAIGLIQALAQDWQRDSVIYEVVSAKAKIGKLSEAMALAKSISRESTRAVAIRVIATEHAKAGKISEALGIVQIITTAAARAGGLRDIAVAQAQAGKVAEARATFAEAIQAARSETPFGSDQGTSWDKASGRAYALTNIAAGQAIAGMKEEARATLALALKEAQSIAYDGPAGTSISSNLTAIATQLKAIRLAEIAKVQIDAGAPDDASSTFALARHAAQSITDEQMQSIQYYQALKGVAAAQAGAGFATEAVRLVLPLKIEYELVASLVAIVEALPN